jgi:NTP pyrophosphatase (non-canonical NTP hydrolase)
VGSGTDVADGNAVGYAVAIAGNDKGLQQEDSSMSDIEKGAQQLSSILGVPVVAIDNRSELHKLWDSTAEFHERFETIEDKEHPFIPAQYRALMEEVAEFSIEVLRDNADDPANLERELADVIVVGMGLLMARGRTLADLRAAMRQVAKDNSAKTHKTHKKNSKGKVAKREKPTAEPDAGSE